MGDKTVTIFIAFRTHDALYHIILRLTVSINSNYVVTHYQLSETFYYFLERFITTECTEKTITLCTLCVLCGWSSLP